MQVTVFSSYLKALQHLVKSCPHYFTTHEFTSDGATASGRGFDAEIAAARTISPIIADTLVEYAANNGRVAGVEVAAGGEAHLGYILMHYRDNGDIVRFVTFE